jgi:hypothetical protein
MMPGTAAAANSNMAAAAAAAAVGAGGWGGPQPGLVGQPGAGGPAVAGLMGPGVLAAAQAGGLGVLGDPMSQHGLMMGQGAAGGVAGMVGPGMTSNGGYAAPAGLIGVAAGGDRLGVGLSGAGGAAAAGTGVLPAGSGGGPLHTYSYQPPAEELVQVRGASKGCGKSVGQHGQSVFYICSSITMCRRVHVCSLEVMHTSWLLTLGRRRTQQSLWQTCHTRHCTIFTATSHLLRSLCR